MVASPQSVIIEPNTCRNHRTNDHELMVGASFSAPPPFPQQRVRLAALGGADECVRPYTAFGKAFFATVHWWMPWSYQRGWSF